ncbi:MAG TPA: ribosome maturation factor RimM [Bacteroidales bacterium]|nr:ribosome maturation factor RimM [Bacteroidales bacterium]
MVYKPGILLGQITKTSGFDGSVIVRLEKKFIENIPEPESVFLEVDGRPVPFFIAEIHGAGPEIRMLFEDYDSIEKVNEFKGCRVYLTSGINVIQDEPDISMLKGFKAYDQDGARLGMVIDIIANPSQMLLVVEMLKGKEVLIPLHEDLVINIDHDKRELWIEVPEGLADINV